MSEDYAHTPGKADPATHVVPDPDTVVAPVEAVHDERDLGGGPAPDVHADGGTVHIRTEPPAK